MKRFSTFWRQGGWYRGGGSSGAFGGPVSGTTITATTQFLAADGTNTAPGYAFTSATNSGWYLSGGSLRSTVGGTNSVVITGAGIAGGSDGTIDLGLSTNHWKRLYMDYTNTGTVGAVTINKAAGRVNIAGSGTAVVVTNSLVTAASHVMVVMSTADATGRVTSVVPAAGSFTINTVAVTAQASFDFFVVNAD